MVFLDLIKKLEFFFNVIVYRILIIEKLCRLFRKFKFYLEFLVKCKINKKCDFIVFMYYLYINLFLLLVYFLLKIYFDF